MAIKLIAVDLDGTVVRSDHSISQRTRTALAACRAAGAHIAIATGRVPMRIATAAAELQAQSLVAASGLLVSSGSQELYRCEIPARDAAAIWHWCRRRSLVAHLWGESCWWSSVDDEHAVNLAEFMGAPHLPGPPTGPVLLGWVHGPDYRGALAAAFGHLHWHAAGAGVYVRRQWADKATGLEQLLRYLHLRPTELAVFGDADNDFEMFDLAAYPVAMGNALPELKAKARLIAPSVEQDGVARVLEEWLKTDLEPVL